MSCPTVSVTYLISCSLDNTKLQTLPYHLIDVDLSLAMCSNMNPARPDPAGAPHQSLATIDQFETWSASLLMLTTCLGYCSRITRGREGGRGRGRGRSRRRRDRDEVGYLMLLFTHCPARASNAVYTLILSTAPGIIGHGIGLAAPAYAAPAYTTHLAAAPVLK